jgi:hypothetical protein
MNSKALAKDRTRAGRMVSSRLFDADFARSLPKTTEGRSRILVAASHDTMDTIYERIYDGPSPLIIAAVVGDELKMIDVTTTPVMADGDEVVDTHEIGPGCTLDFFMGYLTAKRGAVVPFRVVKPEHEVQLSFELV